MEPAALPRGPHCFALHNRGGMATRGNGRSARERRWEGQGVHRTREGARVMMGPRYAGSQSVR